MLAGTMQADLSDKLVLLVEDEDSLLKGMQAWLRDRPQQAFGRHVYDPADYGWTRDGLADEFGSYAKRYGVV